MDRTGLIRKGFGKIRRGLCLIRPHDRPQTSIEIARGMDQNLISVCSPM